MLFQLKILAMDPVKAQAMDLEKDVGQVRAIYIKVLRNNDFIVKPCRYISLFCYKSGVACSWLIATSQDNVHECIDGSSCNEISEGTSCCNNKGGRARCPKNFPHMCGEKICYDDYCCGSTVASCGGKYGGLRICGGRSFERTKRCSKNYQVLKFYL